MFRKREGGAEAAHSAKWGEFNISAWVGGNDPEDGVTHAKTCKARGRYEVARAFQIAGTDWYEKNVVGRPMPGETAEDRKRFKEYLADYRDEIENLRLATLDRNALLTLLAAAPEGLTRSALESGHSLQSSIKLGVMLNQLEKGGWITREGEGKKQLLKGKKPISDAEYLKGDHPKPVKQI